MTYNQIKYFVEAAKCCNFRKASANLFITQQVLSKQIKALELETGILLFERKRQRVTLTEAGTYMYSVWQQLVEQTEQALHMARSMQGKKKIRIGMLDISMLVDTIRPVLEDYLKAHPELEFEFVLGTVNKLMGMFTKKELDMLVIFSIELAGCDEDFDSVILKKIKLGVISSKNHRVTKISKLNLKDLKNEIICVFDDIYAKDTQRHILEDCKKEGFTPGYFKYYDDWRSMELAIYMEQGITITYDTYFEDQGGRLVFSPLITYEDRADNVLAAAWYVPELSELANELKLAFLP